jgi:hypothetical protein
MKRIAILILGLTTAALAQQPTPHVQLEQLPHGLYYHQPSDAWLKLEVVKYSGIKTKHGASAFAGVLPGAVVTYAGPPASGVPINPYDFSRK